MSINLTQHPDTMSFKNAVKEFIVPTQIGVTLSLYLGNSTSGTLLFEGNYQPDFSNNVRIDVSDIIAEQLKTILPSSNNYLQADWSKEFCYRITDGNDRADGTFTVVNAACKTNTAISTWLASNFLTNQPMEQMSCKDAPSWLSFYDADGGLSLVGRFYPKSGGNTDVNIVTTNGAGCYTCNVAYNHIIQRVAALPSSLQGYYDVLLMNGDTVKAKQRYIYSERTGMEQYYCFVNALGGIDTLTCQGENVLLPDITYNIGRFGKNFRQLDDTDTIRTWSQNTGQLPSGWRNWFYEIMAVKAGAWSHENKAYTEIVLNDSNIAASNHGQLQGYTFGYILTENTSVIGSDERATYAFRQSAADAAEEYESDIQSIELAFTDGETEAITVPSNVILVLALANEVIAATPISYYIDGTLEGSFTPSVTEPVQLTLPSGDEIHFTTENTSVLGISMNYYPQTPT